MARMRILTTNEQQAFDKPPLFDHRDRKKYFDLPKGLMDIAKSLRSPGGQIGFLLMCGYFKATKRFYQPQDFHERDIEAIARLLRLPSSELISDAYGKQTRQRHQKIILDFYGFTPFDDTTSNALSIEIATMARMHLKPRLVFDRCVDFLIQNRMQVPSAYRLNDLTEKEEQEIAEACNRLIRNAIICWNYLYLARQVEKAPDPEARENLLRLIAAH